ncbi:MAG: DUF4145 domain-containing protein [Myxococcota bacterium]
MCLFPLNERRLGFQLPTKVKESYDEALRCDEAGANIATAVMVRRTLEAVVFEFDPKSRTLFEALKELKGKGVISDELLRWAHGLRFLGNIGAHPTADVVSDEDANDALDFLQAILETLYHFRPRFQAMQARRGQT